jgi:hypothetical protein
MVFSRCALVRVSCESRKPNSQAKAAQARDDRIGLGIKSLERGQVWHARCVPFARSKTRCFKVRLQRAASGEENIPQVSGTVDWQQTSG